MEAIHTLTDPAQLRDRLDDPALLPVDLTTAENYARHHIPGALFVPYAALVRGAAAGAGIAPGLPPATATLHRLLSALGLTPQRHVVAYDDEGGGKACRLLWTLAMLGHDNWSLLDGGIQGWLNEGGAVSKQTAAPRPSQFRNPVRDDCIADIRYVLDNLDNPAVVLLDARTAEEYSGTNMRALRGGHIPGAVNLDWLHTIDRERGLRLKPAAALRAMLEERGVTPDKEVIPYCQTHHRSAHSFFMLRYMGYPKVRPYPGSWSEWGNRTDTPID